MSDKVQCVNYAAFACRLLLWHVVTVVYGMAQLSYVAEKRRFAYYY